VPYKNDLGELYTQVNALSSRLTYVMLLHFLDNKHFAQEDVNLRAVVHSLENNKHLKKFGNEQMTTDKQTSFWDCLEQAIVLKLACKGTSLKQ
jgi:hypothetical protein